MGSKVCRSQQIGVWAFGLLAAAALVCLATSAFAQSSGAGGTGWDAYYGSLPVYGEGVVLRRGENERDLLLSGRGSLAYRANSASGPGVASYGSDWWDSSKAVASEAHLTLRGWAFDLSLIHISEPTRPY